MTRAATSVRPATPEDYPAIAGVLDRTLGARPYEQRLALWKWRYDANPARTDAFPSFLVVEEGGRIVGAHGLIPLRLKAGNDVLPISCSCDLAVDAASRSAGMKLKLAALAKELSPLHLSTSANEAACKITVALGGKEISRSRRNWIRPLKASGLINRKMPGVGTAIWKPIDWAMAAVRSMKHPFRVSGGEIADVAVFDDRYDRFNMIQAEDRRIFVVRDAPYLSWRYSGYPFPGIQSFELARGKVLLGFAVIHLSLDGDGLRFAAILELSGQRGEHGITEHLLGEATRRAVAWGAHYMIARTLVREDENILRKTGFLLRELHYSPVTYKNNSDVRNELFVNDDNWYLTLGDGDGCYYYAS